MSSSGDQTGYMGFVGVTTTHSSIRKVFPEWARALGLPTDRLIGHDIPMDAESQAYCDVIEQIRNDPRHFGALVTTHKMSVFQHARQLFDDLDELAVTFGEISSVAKRDGRLTGAAKDPVTVRLALEEFLPADHFAATGASAVVLGSGGSGCALSHQLGMRVDRPAEIICTARRESSLDHQRELHDRAGIPGGVMRYVLTSGPEEADALVHALPPGSLVVNATGLGKDRPGSPLTDSVVFPEHGVVWEFNYRGSLEFLRQARAQEVDRQLVVEDGWRYFVHGWTQVIADVFDIPMPAPTVSLLSELAARHR